MWPYVCQKANERFELLPFPYAVALRMRAAGQDDDAIAIAVGVEVQSVRLLLEVGEDKLAALEHDLMSAHHSNSIRKRGSS